MSGCREIITLQFGHYSNFVGAHFWNIQELSFDYTGQKKSEVNHDVLYREGGGGGDKTTYTPRLLLTDLRGALGSMSASGGLVEQKPQQILETIETDMPVEKQEEAPIEKNQYLKYINNELDCDPTEIDEYDFESKVKTWTDYLFPRFHHRTVTIIDEYKHDDYETPFEVYPSGTRMWKDPKFTEDFSDNIRKYAEECDNFQGFQIFLDATDAFGGLGNSCIEYLTDEYHNKTILAMPLTPSYFKDNYPQTDFPTTKAHMRDSIKVLNTALTYANLFENASMFVPMCCGQDGWRKPGQKIEFYNVNYNSELNYHSSAIIASAFDTFSFGYRLKSNGFTLSDLCNDLTIYGRKLTAASLALPFYMKQNTDLIEHIDKADFPLWTCITPSCNIPMDKIIQYVTLRGVSDARLKKPLRDADEQIRLRGFNCDTVKEYLEHIIHWNYCGAATNMITSPLGLEIKTPYPKIFSKNLDINGFEKVYIGDNEEVESVPILSGLHNGSFIYYVFKSLQREFMRAKMEKIYQFREEGMEFDDFVEHMEKLLKYKDHYKNSIEL